MFCSSNNKCSQATSEVDHTPTENMVIDTLELDSKSDPFMSKQEKKVKRKHRRKKLYYETEGMRSMFFLLETASTACLPSAQCCYSN